MMDYLVVGAGEVYYPVPSPINQVRYRHYEKMAAALQDRVIFGGRLARYVYIDMAPTIRMALNTARRETANLENIGC